MLVLRAVDAEVREGRLGVLEGVGRLDEGNLVGDAGFKLSAREILRPLLTAPIAPVPPVVPTPVPVPVVPVPVFVPVPVVPVPTTVPPRPLPEERARVAERLPVTVG